MKYAPLPSTEILILGATVTGCGAACALSARGISAAVIERAQMCAAEYADALYTDGDTAAYVPQTEDGAAFAAELSRRGILTDEGISLPTVAPVISARFVQCGAPLYAPARITDIAAEADGYRVTFVSMGGSFTLSCRAILDTTASFVSRIWLGSARPAMKTMLGAHLFGDGGAVHGGHPRESYFHVDVTDGDFDRAREELLAKAEKMGERVITSPMTAAQVSESFGALCDTVTHLSSTSFGTVTAAYDAGAQWGLSYNAGSTVLPTRIPSAADGGEYDVIVCGGGTAGAMAALTAAKEGGRVLLLEDGVALGGIGTVGGILYYYYGVAGGAYEEVDEFSKALQKELSILPYKHVGELSKRMAYGRLLKKYGVTVRYEATAVDVLRTGNRITGVRWREENGFAEARAAFVLDATADGWILRAADAPTMQGRESDGCYQPYSNVYTVFRESRGLEDAEAPFDPGQDPAEIAVLSMNEAKLEKLAEQGNKKAKRLSKLTREPARFLATIQVAITLSGFLGSAFAADNFSDPLVAWLIGLGIKIPEATLNTIAVILITLILSYFTLVLGELVPKRIAMQKSEQLALGVSGLVSGISVLFRPIVWFLSVSTNAVLRLMGIDPAAEEEEVTEATQQKVYYNLTMTGETKEMLIPVGTVVTTSLGAKTTFSRLAAGDQLKIKVETDAEGKQVILAIWIIG